MSGHPVLRMEQVSKTFITRYGIWGKRRFEAVKCVELSIAKGEVVGLIGESGSGKTTLSRMAMGLIVPTGGKIELDGRALPGYTRLERAAHVQMVYQDPASSLNPRRTIRSMLEEPLIVHGVRSSQDRSRRVSEILDLVGLEERHGASRPTQMSGGQRQRVAIARALILRPHLVICDEPTSALDVSIQAQILNLLLELRDRLGLSYLFVSHNLAVVQHVATRVAVMQAGQIVETGDADSVFSRPAHQYTQMLLASVLRPNGAKVLSP